MLKYRTVLILGDSKQFVLTTQNLHLKKKRRSIRSRKERGKREGEKKMKESKIAGVITQFKVPMSYYVIKHTEVCNVSDTA